MSKSQRHRDELIKLGLTQVSMMVPNSMVRIYTTGALVHKYQYLFELINNPNTKQAALQSIIQWRHRRNVPTSGDFEDRLRMNPEVKEYVEQARPALKAYGTAYQKRLLVNEDTPMTEAYKAEAAFLVTGHWVHAHYNHVIEWIKFLNEANRLAAFESEGGIFGKAANAAN